MGRSLSPIVQRELANLDKDAESRRTAMKTLKSYANDLDSKALPLFLAQVSEKKGPTSSSGECTISLFEVLARVHGRNIVPQIDNNMTTIIHTLCSSAGSFLLHQACSKVVPAIAHYAIDPSISDAEKTKIISSLCKPLSNTLMGSHESLASGSALCLKALIESNNWKFASNDLVNEVCLKVAGALEEKTTQTNSHIGVVMTLAKHNVLIVEAYARSLLRSGLQILSAGVLENNSQKRFSAIQMINFLMKCVDSRSISMELAKVADALEKCQDDHMPYVRGAAFEALKTAKSIISQKGSQNEISSSPVCVIHRLCHPPMIYMNRMEGRLVIDGSESVSSTDDLHESSAEKEEVCKVGTQVSMEMVKRSSCGRSAVSIIWALLLVFLAIIFLAKRFDDDEVFYNVPT